MQHRLLKCSWLGNQGLFYLEDNFMKGFRKINGANWLDEVHVNYFVNNGVTDITSIGKLPLHWNKVRGIL